MKITEKEARELCNSVEIKLVEDSYPNRSKTLSAKKLTTRLQNSLKATEYWKSRFEKLEEDFKEKKKQGKTVPLLPEIKKESFKRKSLLFKECAQRYKKAIQDVEKQESASSKKVRISKKRK